MRDASAARAAGSGGAPATTLPADPDGTAPRWMLPAICSAAFLVFAQTFMVAPLLPRLAAVFGSDVGWVGLAIPAYVVPQALSILVAGPLSDRLGRRGVILGALALFSVVTAATATAGDVGTFIGWRVAAGIVAAGVVPIGLTLIGDVIPYARRGRAVGWLFGSIAGGTATGAAVGALVEPIVGWRGLFLVVAAMTAAVVATAAAARAFPRVARPQVPPSWLVVLRGYVALLAQRRAQRTYGYVLLNAILQSGVFTWLGVYLHTRYALDEPHIGLVLLGYGVPGLVFGPLIGKLADRWGRARIIPAGIALTALCALALMPALPLAAVQVAIILLSLGFDLTQPLLAAIATNLPGARGQAVALMAFSLFGGFGLGSLLFQLVLRYGFDTALATFGGIGLVAAVAALAWFRDERPRARSGPPAPAAAR